MSETNKFFIASDTLIKVLSLRDAETLDYINAINGGSAKMTLCRLETKTPKAGEVSVTEAAGAKTKITITAHGLPLDADAPPYAPGDEHVHIQGTRNFDGEADIFSVPDANNIVIDMAFVLEKFKGTEVIYFAVKNGWEIALTHAVGVDPDGYWDGIEPDTLIGLLEKIDYYLFVEFIKGAVKKTFRIKWPAEYDPVV